MRRSLPSACLLVLLALGLGSGCGKQSVSETPAAEQAPASAAPSATTAAEEPQTLDEAEALLARAQSELDQVMPPLAFAQAPGESAAADEAPRSERSSGAGAPSPAPAPPPAKAAAGPRDAEAAQEPAPSAEAKKESNDCELACRAYGSLNRAVEAVCRLDSGGERCARARRIASDAGNRVQSCSCPKQ